MSNNKVMIVGTGNVGASIGFCLASQRTTVNELILTDIDQNDAEGEALDLRDTLAVSPTFLQIRAGSYEDAKDCAIVIITAGANQKEGETRLDLLNKNAQIMQGIVEPIMESGFDGIFLVVSNPMDVLTYLTWKISGLPENQVMGSGTVLDSARLCLRISEHLDIHPKSISAMQLGEHGDSEFTYWSGANVSGTPLTAMLQPAERESIENFARNEAYDIINKKGATYYGIGACVTRIVDCILGDEKRVLPVSSYDAYANVYNGFPAVIGRSGVIRRLEVQLSEQEAIKLQKSNNTLHEAIRSLDISTE